MGSACWVCRHPKGCSDAGVGVLDVVDRVLGRVLRDLVQVQSQRRVRRRPRERVPGGIHADRLDQLVERDQIAGALAQTDRLTVANQIHQLPDQHLDMRVRIVAGAGRQRPEPVDVAVMIRAEQVEALVETALTLVDVVRRVGGEIGGLAIALDQHTILVVAEVGRS